MNYPSEPIYAKKTRHASRAHRARNEPALAAAPDLVGVGAFVGPLLEAVAIFVAPVGVEAASHPVKGLLSALVQPAVQVAIPQTPLVHEYVAT